MSSVEILLRAAFAWLIYPGLFFLIVVGTYLEGVRRQFAVRTEGREPPPLLQPFYDLAKIWRRPAAVPAGAIVAGEETEANGLAMARQEGNRLALYALPVGGLLALATGVVLLPLPGNPWPFLTTGGTRTPALGADLLGVGLLLLVPGLAAMLVGSLGGSVYGQLAGSRIFQLLVIGAVPYAVAVFGPALAYGSLNLQMVASSESMAMIGTKVLCGLLYLLCLPVLLRLRPLAASTGEVLEGVMVDLSGPPLALFGLMQNAERLALPLAFGVLFVPFAATNPFLLLAGLGLALGLVATVETLFSQVRMRDALNFYLRVANPAALVLLIIGAFAVKV